MQSSMKELDVTEICKARDYNIPDISCHVNYDAFTEDETASPIVFFFHGRGGLSEAFHFFTGASSKKLIGVYPQGNGGWNTGMSDSIELDDVKFIKEIIVQLRKIKLTGNIYVVGSGTGAEFAYLLAANADTKTLPIKGVIAKAMSLLKTPAQHNDYNTLPTKKSLPVSVLQIMGNKDLLVPFDGGATDLYKEGYTIMNSKDSFRTWVQHNKCLESAEEKVVHKVTDSGELKSTSTRYECLDSGTIVQLDVLKGVNHAVGNVKIEDNGEKTKVDYDYIYNFIHDSESAQDCANDSEFFAIDHGKGPHLSCDYFMNEITKCGWSDASDRTAKELCKLACEPNCHEKKKLFMRNKKDATPPNTKKDSKN